MSRGTIGELERLAGVTDRAAFWQQFSHIEDPRIYLDCGVAELNRLRRERTKPACPECGCQPHGCQPTGCPCFTCSGWGEGL